jgi:hypothetical protein
MAVDLDGWADLVSLRLLVARTIDERTPPGAAAVLLNVQHTYGDLVLPIGKAERLVVEAIDGGRSMREVTVRDEPTRAFFRDLWTWDQLVFDASGTSTAHDGATRVSTA